MKSLLVLLLIVLKEVGPTAACSSSCSSRCWCDNRGLSSVPHYLPTTITHLYLYNNSITTLSQSDFFRYSSLTTISLTLNQISVINSGAFYNLASLSYLYLYNNQLTDIRADMFVGLDNLGYLYLYDNNIHSIEAGTFVNLSRLRTLQLHNNQLTSLTADMFKGLDNLEDLYLHENDISRWPSLRINDNQMETLPSMAYDILASILTVNISNNPWQCDCRMLGFKRKMTGGREFEKQMTCAGPSKFEGESLYSVDHVDLILDLILGPICQETATSPGASTDVYQQHMLHRLSLGITQCQ
ncbi:SLIT and NTRK-like protein 2 [Branchiostoma floridae]|uniref:SLIT and NTRK-like protein 2 n=1 Tax=Branchiostoma floridae TaxID=7739 RepID=A0A9J7KBB2_BRAFL|nr:SLIT and NTRK-like protein 2 [Branchiostoma floridae]